MKILYVAPEFPCPGNTAAQVRANALLPRLAERFDLCVAAASDAEGDVQGLDVVRMRSHRITLVDASLAALGGEPRAFRRFDRPGNRRTLAACLDRFRPDVVHFDMIATLGLHQVVKRVAPSARSLAHIHDADSRAYAGRVATASGFARLDLLAQSRRILRVERRLLPRFDLVLVDSAEDAAYLELVSGRAEVKVLPLGFDSEAVEADHARVDLTGPSVVYSGAMNGAQSQDGAVFLAKDIMPRVWAERPDARLYVVGANPSRVVQRLASDRVTVTGFVANLGAYLRSATVYACPLRIGSGMRTRVVEALAYGAPLVATQMAVRGLEVPGGGSQPWLVADDAAGIAAHICAVLDGKHANLGAQGAEYARARYSWDAVVDRLSDYYIEMTRARP